jgi:hypothetical protein
MLCAIDPSISIHDVDMERHVPDRDANGMFGLRNHYIHIEVMHHEFIPQIWWDDLIHHISTN